MKQTFWEATIDFFQYLGSLLFARDREEALMHPANAPETHHDAPHTPPTQPHTDFISHFAACIRDYEGKPGDLNYRNNNPGNFRCSAVGYAKMYGDVRCVNNFSVFPTYELGWLYLCNILKERIAKHPNWGLLDFMSNYAPSADNNNPERYAAYIASRLAIDVHYPLSHCL